MDSVNQGDNWHIHYLLVFAHKKFLFKKIFKSTHENTFFCWLNITYIFPVTKRCFMESKDAYSTYKMYLLIYVYVMSY